MKTRLSYYLCAVVAAAVILLQTNCQPTTPSPGDGKCAPCKSPATCADVTFSQQDFPPEFDYMPGNTAVFNEWVSKRNGKKIREHAWNLWVGLNQPAQGEPDKLIWQTWKTATQAFEDSELGPSRPMTQRLKQLTSYPDQDPNIERKPPRYMIPNCLQERYGIDTVADVKVDGCQYQFNGDVMIAGVPYNRPAFDWMRNKSQPLYLKKTLEAELAKSIAAGNPYASIGQFPDSSFVLKPMLWPVKKTGYTPLPVWDNVSPEATENNTKYPGFENQEFWKRAVAITPDTTGKPKTIDSLRFLYSVLETSSNAPLINIYPTAPVHSIQEFYHWQIDSTQLAGMSCSDRLILDLSAWWCYGRPFEADDYVVLIAMHIFSKEFPDWTMQTAWWYDKLEDSRFSGNKPKSFGGKPYGPWDKYLIATTYGQAQKQDTSGHKAAFCDVPGGNNSDCWPVIYNPYIELGGLHPIATNCRNCHWRAGWTTDSIATNYQAMGGPTAIQTFDSTNTLLFKNVIRTDFLWSIPDRVLPNPTVQ
ncbi:MAG: hypothetical protein AAGG75_20360 [Bacteroidota bacterium]